MISQAHASAPGDPATTAIPTPPRAQSRPAVVAALHDEAGTLTPRGKPLPAGVLAGISGVGPERAARTARELIERGATTLLSWGTAGALDDTVRPGDLVIYGLVRSRDGAEYRCDEPWSAALAARLAPLAPRIVTGSSSASAVSADVGRKALGAATGATVVDMESTALAAVAAAARIPFAVVRCVVDPVGFAFPQAALAGLAPDGRTRAGKTVATLVRRPYELLDLLRLAGWYRLALGRLRLAADRCLPDFAC